MTAASLRGASGEFPSERKSILILSGCLCFVIQSRKRYEEKSRDMITQVRAKKHLGQHFLKDLSIARRIAESLELTVPTDVLEIGPGMGVLTQYLLKDPNARLTAGAGPGLM